MAKVELRRPIQVPSDAVPGEGLVSEQQDEIVAVSQNLVAMPEDDARPVVLEPLQWLAASLMAALRRQWRIADSVESKSQDPATKRLLDQGQAMAAGALPTSGWGSPGELEGARATERARVLRQFQAEITRAVVDKMRPSIAREGIAVVEAATESKRAIKEAIGDAEAPSALNADIQLRDLAIRKDTEEEIDSWRDEKMRRTLQALDNAFAIRDQAKREERLKNLIPAAMRAANVVLSTPPQKLAAARELRTGRMATGPHDDTPHMEAKRVLRRIREYRESQFPRSIAIAQESFARLRRVFEVTMGRSAAFMTRDNRRAAYDRGDVSALSFEWALDEDFPFRFSPPYPWGMALSGWSPIVAVESSARRSGFPVRQPASVAPLVRAEVQVDRDDPWSRP
jgi:hypothetical protein